MIIHTKVSVQEYHMVALADAQDQFGHKVSVFRRVGEYLTEVEFNRYIIRW